MKRNSLYKYIIFIFFIIQICFCVIGLMICATVAQPLPYSLSGHVIDSGGTPIEGAKIILTNERTGDIILIYSYTNGEYQEDAYSFANHYQYGDIIRYNVSYNGLKTGVTSVIDISKGGNILNIIIDNEDIEVTPTPASLPVTLTPYSLSGYILNNESQYIVGAEITLTNIRTNDILELTSTEYGEYQEDAYNFESHYQDGDTIRYDISYENTENSVTASIDTLTGGIFLNITLNEEVTPIPTLTPIPTPTSTATPHKSSGSNLYKTIQDNDGDGYKNSKEIILGTDPNDPCDPDNTCKACLEKIVPKETDHIKESIPKPTATPTPRRTVKEVTALATPRPTKKPTPTPMPLNLTGITEPIKPFIPIVAIILIITIPVVIYFIKYRKNNSKETAITWGTK